MPLFIDHFLRKYNQEYGRTLNIDIKARIFLTEYRWPGNVRQLENVIKRLVLLSTGQSVDTEQVKAILDLEGSSVPAVDAEAGAPDAVDAPRERKIVSLDEMERDYLERALEKFGYNISLTAKALEISRKTMHNKLKKYGIVIRKTTGV